MNEDTHVEFWLAVKKWNATSKFDKDMRAKQAYRAATRSREGKYEGMLRFTTVGGPIFMINGVPELKFKTRGKHENDLREACQKYDIDFWESDIPKIAKQMENQLYEQMLQKQRILEENKKKLKRSGAYLIDG